MELIKNFIILGCVKNTIFFFVLLFFSCSGFEESEREKVRKLNAKAELIHRNHDEYHYAISPPKYRQRAAYPWESSSAIAIEKITKEFFRCKGVASRPLRLEKTQMGEVRLFDCSGGGSHPLPIKEGKEFVYPVLIDILNYVQARTKTRVVITSGHHCLAHHHYLSLENSHYSSKHLSGAAVTFYVEGYEKRPQEVVELIVRFYKENARYRGKKEFEQFLRFENSVLAQAPYYNREIALALYAKEEGRDADNSHSYPYFSLQVLFDRETNQKIP